MRVRSLCALIVLSAGALAPLACTSILGDYAIGSAGDAAVAPGEAAVDEATLPDAADPCPGTQVRCNGTCRDTTNDMDNCGPSCKICTAGAHASRGCAAGACTAPCDVGFTACGSPAACVDLTNDPLHCRTCEHSCQGGRCTASTCQPVLLVAAADTGQVNDLASDGTVVVWADGRNNSVNQVSTPGGAKIVLSSASNPRNVAIRGTKVDWMEFNISTGTTKRGRAVAGSANSGSVLTSFTGVSNGLVSNTAGTQVFTCRMLAATSFDLYSCDDTGTCTSSIVVTSSKAGFSLALDPNDSYAVFSDITNAKIVMFKLSNSVASDVTGQDSAFWVASDTSNAYWANNGTSPTPIMSAALGSTTATAILQDATATVDGIATDGTNVYFVIAGSIRYVPVAGASTAVTLTQVTSGGHLKYESRALYYTETNGIYRVATP